MGCVHTWTRPVAFPTERVLPEMRKNKSGLKQDLISPPPPGLKIRNPSDSTTWRGWLQAEATQDPPPNLLQVGSRSLLCRCCLNQLTNVLRALRTAAAAGHARSQVLLSAYVRIYPHADIYTNNFIQIRTHATIR